MAARGWTKKPCPVCGSTGGRLTNRVCAECQSVFEDGKRLQAAHMPSEEKLLVIHSTTFHWISRPYIMRGGGGLLSSGLTERLTRTWSALTNAIAREPGVPDPWVPDEKPTPPMVSAKPGLWGIQNDFTAYKENFFLVDKQIHAALNSYDTTVRLALEFCYIQGKLDGLNLLMQLNAGTESPSDFSDTEEKLKATINRIKKDLEAKL